jgi:7-cyano-7-deazaguanine synthase
MAINVACQANADTVTIGCNKDDADMFPDCTTGFIKAMNDVSRAAGYNVEVCAPYLDKTKSYIGALAQELGVPWREVWTCYNGGEFPCGECPACLKMRKAVK